VAERRAARWRSALAWALLLVLCAAAPVALLTGWARATVRQEEVYAGMARGLAADPDLQLALAQIVTERAEAALIAEDTTASDAIRLRAVTATLSAATGRIVAGEAFPAVWEAANRGAHRLLTATLATAQRQPVILDLSPLQGAIAAEIARMDVELPPEWALDPADLRVEIINADAADRIRGAAALVDVGFAAALAVAILALALSVGLAPDRLAAVARAGFALAVGMIAVIALLVTVEAWLISAAGSVGAGTTVAMIVDVVSQGLRAMAIALAVIGLLIAALFAGLRGLRGSPVRRSLPAE
jgi:hypothetical protein